MRFIQYETLVAPAAPPVTVAEFIDHARLNGLTVDRQPELIARELAAATERAERYLRRSLITQTLRGLYVPQASGTPGAALMILPRGKVQSVARIVSGTAELIDGAGYTLEWNTISLDQPFFSVATVEWVSGYGDDATDVPAMIREGILEYATTLYEDRGGDREAKYQASADRSLPLGILDLWRPYQIELGG